MKTTLSFLLVLFSYSACTSDSGPISSDSQTIQQDNKNESINGRIRYTGHIALPEGPHHLLSHRESLYAVRDQDLYLFNLKNPKLPTLQQKVSATKGIFGKPFAHNEMIWIPTTHEGMLYAYSNDLHLQKRLTIPLSTFQPTCVLIDRDEQLWIGGSNGAKGVLAQFSLRGATLQLVEYWQATDNQSSIQSLLEVDNRIIAGLANGQVVQFIKNELDKGPLQQLSFSSQPGQEPWGRTLCKVGTTYYFANWGAGISLLEQHSQGQLQSLHGIGSTELKKRFPYSEGANVYDLAYNATHELLFVANGWSGLLLLQPKRGNLLVDYIDLPYFQHRSVATTNDYIYAGNISGGMSGDLKGILIYEIKK